MRAPLELAGPRAALAECLQGCQPLHRVEEVGAEGAVRAIASEARLAIAAVPEGGRQQHDERRDQQHQRHRQIHERHEREDEQRRESRDEELRQVLTEIRLELLHSFHEGKHDVAGPGAHEVCGTERGNLREEHLPQPFLYPSRGAVGDHRARVVERATHHQCQRGERNGRRELGEQVARQDATQKPAEQGESRDSGGDRGEADEHRAGDPAANAGRECPESPVEVHPG